MGNYPYHADSQDSCCYHSSLYRRPENERYAGDHGWTILLLSLEWHGIWYSYILLVKYSR